jgi:hypothetical protein
VVSLFPGRTATPMQAKITHAQGQRYAPAELIQPLDVGELVLAIVTCREPQKLLKSSCVRHRHPFDSPVLMRSREDRFVVACK